MLKTLKITLFFVLVLLAIDLLSIAVAYVAIETEMISREAATIFILAMSVLAILKASEHAGRIFR